MENWAHEPKSLNRKEPLSAHAYDLVAKYGDQAGLEEVTPHTLRHTFAHTLVSQGVQVSDVADLLRMAIDLCSSLESQATKEPLLSVARLDQREIGQTQFH